jgi:putative hemolysin
LSVFSNERFIPQGCTQTACHLFLFSIALNIHKKAVLLRRETIYEYMPFISADDLIHNKLWSKSGGKILINLLFSATGIARCNRIYDSVNQKQLRGFDALDDLIRESGFRYDCSLSDRERIPRQGPFIVVANHPFGMAEGLILTRILAEVRPDIRVVANYMLGKLKIISNYWLEVNPFENNRQAFNSTKSLRACFKAIEEGHPLLIFPAGEVSTWQQGFRRCEDRSWNQPIMKFIQKAKVPVLPVYIHGANSKRFHLAGKIHPSLRTVCLPNEYLNKRGQCIRFRIGLPVPVKEQDRYHDLETYSKVLRLYSYALQLPYTMQEPAGMQKYETPSEIVPAINPQDMLPEIEQLRNDPDRQLVSVANFTVFCSKPAHIPAIMREIARLREITFREVGEGSNKASDTDRFDDYYYQLFVWDNAAGRIAGAYRIGAGREILEQHGGLSGFYLNSLFDFDPPMKPLLQDALELGRSFIIKEYQKQHSVLLALWKGLLLAMVNRKTHYLFGAVSISGKFSATAKALTVEFIKAAYFDHSLAAFAHNKDKAAFKLFPSFDRETFRQITGGDFGALDTFIQSVDPGFATPTLVRQYTQMLNTSAIGFNVDPHFNNCLDALIYMDIRKIPARMLLMLCKDMESNPGIGQLIDTLPQGND